VLTKDEKLVTT
jgi:hypothetical protein